AGHCLAAKGDTCRGTEVLHSVQDAMDKVHSESDLMRTTHHTDILGKLIRSRVEESGVTQASSNGEPIGHVHQHVAWEFDVNVLYAQIMQIEVLHISLIVLHP